MCAYARGPAADARRVGRTGGPAAARDGPTARPPRPMSLRARAGRGTMATPPLRTHHQPRLETRPAQPYLGIVGHAADEAGFRAAADRDVPALFGRLAQRGLVPAGPPFVRYLVVDETRVPQDGPPPARFAWAAPLGQPAEGDDLLHAGELPAGRWIVALHRGGYAGLGALHGIVHSWAWEEGHVVAREPAEGGTAFGGAVEHFRVGPHEDLDPWAWETDVAYLLEG